MQQLLPLWCVLIFIMAACSPQAIQAPVREAPTELISEAPPKTPPETAEATVMPAITATASQIATVQAHERSYPLDTRTDIPELDALLAAVASGDVDELRPLVQFSSLECTRQKGLGGPPKCREGEAEGTPVEALPFLGSEGSFLRRDEYERWPGIDASGLYAVYQNSSDVYDHEFYPAGEQTILLASSRETEIIALRVSDGRIVRIDSLPSFGMESLDTTLEREAARMILAPVSP